MSTASLLVEIKPKAKDRLDHLKLHPDESYDGVIDRLANSVLDEEPLDLETQGKTAEAMKNLKEGRCLPPRDPGDVGVFLNVPGALLARSKKWVKMTKFMISVKKSELPWLLQLCFSAVV